MKYNSTLTLDEVRSIEKHKNLADAEPETLIDDSVSFARLYLDHTDTTMIKIENL